MSIRKMHEIGTDARRVKVYYNSGLSEYCARLYVNGTLYEPADYFSDDRADAIATAGKMVDAPDDSAKSAALDLLAASFGD